MSEAPGKRALRLIEAIEILLTEEEISLQAGVAGIAAIQRRSTPLVNELVRLTESPEVLTLKPRIQQLFRRRQAITARLESRMGEIRGRLAQLNLSQGNLRRMAPAYRLASRPQRLAESV